MCFFVRRLAFLKIKRRRGERGEHIIDDAFETLRTRRLC